MLTIRVSAQTAPEVLYFSRLTKSFDQQPPIGEGFQIKGSITNDILAVKVESFGFINPAHQQLINTLIGQDNSALFCDELDRARTDNDILKSSVSWERPEGSQGSQLTLFTVNHPRLYYNRKYVFLHTFYKSIDQASQKRIAKQFLMDLIPEIVDKVSITREMLGQDSEDIWKRELGKITQELQGKLSNNNHASCTSEIIHRKTLLSVDIAQLFDPYLATQTQALRGRLRYEQGLKEMMPSLKMVESELFGLDEVLKNITKNVLADNFVDVIKDMAWIESTFTKNSTVYKHLQPFITRASNLKNNGPERTYYKNNVDEIIKASITINARFQSLTSMIEAKAWDKAQTESTLLAAELQGAFSSDKLFSAVGKIQLGLSHVGNLPLEEIVDEALENFEFKDHEEILVSTLSQPYFETMAEHQKFLISLDGGLNYIADFEEIIPSIGVNIKLNRVDFDDPIDRTPEYSIILGLTMNAPDDLDPDFRGIFGGMGSNSLTTGLGIRIPSLSRLIRFQGGGVWYKQTHENPLVNDLKTKGSFYFGISLNWDTIDFATSLFRTRSNFNIGY